MGGASTYHEVNSSRCTCRCSGFGSVLNFMETVIHKWKQVNSMEDFELCSAFLNSIYIHKCLEGKMIKQLNERYIKEEKGNTLSIKSSKISKLISSFQRLFIKSNLICRLSQWAFLPMLCSTQFCDLKYVLSCNNWS